MPLVKRREGSRFVAMERRVGILWSSKKKLPREKVASNDSESRFASVMH